MASVKESGSTTIHTTPSQVTSDAGGQLALILGCHDKVHDSKRLIEAAWTSAAFLRAAIDALAGRTGVIDKGGNIVMVNRCWREFPESSWGTALLEGDNYFDNRNRSANGHPEADIMASSLRSVLAGGADPPPLEYACHTPTQNRWVQTWMHGFSQGADRFVVITHQDVTAVRLAANRVVAEKLRETVAIIAAGVAHEFKSLLFAAALKLHELHPRHPGDDYTGMAKAAELIHQAQSLSSALLNLYASPETGRMELLPLYPWLPETVARLSMILPRGISVTTEVEFDLPEAMGHALGVEQVLRNLLINAANVLENYGEIRVRATLASVDGRPMVEIRISDKGPGIPEGLRSRIFEPGFTTTTRSYRSGLGLAIASQLLDQFGGSISYEPVTPTGSTFVVRLLARPEDN